MSLILDALNRADQERSQENNAPNLHSGHSAPLQSDRPIRRWLIEGAIIVFVVVALVYSQFFQRDFFQDTTSQDTAFQHNPKPEQSTPEKIITVPTQATIAVEPTIKSLAPQALDINIATTTEAEKPVPVKAAQTDITIPSTESVASNTAAITSLYQKAPPQASVDKSPTSVAKQQAVATPKPRPIDNGQAILQQIPLLAQMSSRFQNTIPAIDYTVHVYSDSENTGFVNLNGSIRKIGSHIVPGLIVIAILKDSVVLDYNGTQFRLLALNSWVNFN